VQIEPVAEAILIGRKRDRVMANTCNSRTDRSHSLVYEIRIKGHLGPEWTDWFEGMTITLEINGETLLTGPLVDQAALHSVLKKVRDLGMPLLSVIHVQLSQADGSSSV
jgi:hypothetical protein